MTRRQCLELSALLGGSALLSGCSRVLRQVVPRDVAGVAENDNVTLTPQNAEPTARLLNRITFGARPDEIARVAKIGKAAYVEEQLRGDLEEPNVLQLRLHAIDIFQTDAMEMRDLQESEVLRQLQKATILRAVLSRNQLRERLVDFWSNHFNIYAHKGLGAYFAPLDGESVIRAHALGKFPEMLRASAHSPAMLSYLDNDANRRGVPNENYARELMELHTMGARGGYTQRDVQEVARCFSGWTIEDRFLHRRGTFRFDAESHDDGAKTVLGVPIPAGGGQNDGDRVLDILSAHPVTAHFIAGKLCRYFLGDANTTWTTKLAQIYQKTGGDIRAMLRPLLLSDELISALPIVKRPFDFLVSSLRALNADTDGDSSLQTHLSAMGQGLYEWPMPDGHPDATAAWTGSLLARWNFALALCYGDINGTQIDLSGFKKSENPLSALAERLYARNIDAKLSSQLSRAIRVLDGENEDEKIEQIAALLLCAPTFQWR